MLLLHKGGLVQTMLMLNKLRGILMLVILKVDILENGFNCDDIPLHLVDTILQLWKTTVHRIGFCAGNDLHTEIVAVSWKCRPLSTSSFSVQG
jgi:hypothetical protein